MICPIKRKGSWVGCLGWQRGRVRTFFLFNPFPLFQIKVEPLNSYFSIIQRKKGTFRNQWQSLINSHWSLSGMGLTLDAAVCPKRCQVSPPRIPFCDHFKPSFWINNKGQSSCMRLFSAQAILGTQILGNVSGEWNNGCYYITKGVHIGALANYRKYLRKYLR